MTNENKLAAMDAVGELPDFGNLLLKEGGFPHLPDPAQWRDGVPAIPGLYETEIQVANTVNTNMFQCWDGSAWSRAYFTKEKTLKEKHIPEDHFETVKWREVQP